jgi:hypothetical protein
MKTYEIQVHLYEPADGRWAETMEIEETTLDKAHKVARLWSRELIEETGAKVEDYYAIDLDTNEVSGKG